MCGRFALITPPVRLAHYFQAALDDGVDPERRPSFNVAPTTQVFGLSAQRDGDDLTRTLSQYRWGLIPSWAKEVGVGNRLFNARGETAAAKPSFRAAFKARRIIIPADGFYEWQAQSGGDKQPHYFTRTDGEPLALAGLSERWWDKELPEDAPPIRSCTIITTSAGEDMDGIHDRMPVILNPDTFDLWLDPDVDEVSELTSLIHPAPAGTITHHPVSTRVGSVRNNDDELITPI